MRRLFGFILILLSFFCYAETPGLEKKILKQANSEMEVATKRFEETIQKCNKISDNRDIDVSLFKDVLFDDLRYSLLYLSRKATDKCSLDEWKNYAFALIKFKRVYEQYGKPPPDEVSILSSIHFNARQDMELKEKHKNTPSKYRIILDNMNELKIPFKATKIVKKIQEAYYQKQK